MERKIKDEFIKWSADDNKKPMLLYGVSGCGKTYSVLDFGETNYKNTIYFDCVSNLELNYIFTKNNTIEKIVRGLSAISLQTILPNDTLIIFDNVTDKIISYLKKYFAVNSVYHIIAVTNSKEMFNKKNIEFSLKTMNLVSFREYLKYIDKEQMINFIEDSFNNNIPMAFHNLAFEYFNDYLITGGYPDSIINYSLNKKVNLLVANHKKNETLLESSLLNMDNLIDIKRGNEVFNSISYQLIKENKKFQYGMLKSGARAKEYEKSIRFLVNNDIVYSSVKLLEIKTPLHKFKDEESFKLYYNDSGLLFKKLNVNFNKVLMDDRLMNVLYENNIANVLKQNGFNLYYYQSTGKSEVDFVIQTRTGKIIPIELIKKDISKSKSLGLIMNRFNLKNAIRIGRDNFSSKKGVKYIPYYAAFCIKENL